MLTKTCFLLGGGKDLRSHIMTAWERKLHAEFSRLAVNKPKTWIFKTLF